MLDITKAQHYATELLKEHPISESICESILSRLERMLSSRVTHAKHEAKAKRMRVAVPKPVNAAMQLRKYLLEQTEMRLETGEIREIVELEIQWVDWLVEVTASGVMHLKVPGCTCRPELMAEGEEN